jgi:hypothetical protein
MSRTVFEKSRHEITFSQILQPSDQFSVSGGVPCNHSFLHPLYPYHGIVYCQLKPIILSDLS